MTWNEVDFVEDDDPMMDSHARGKRADALEIHYRKHHPRAAERVAMVHLIEERWVDGSMSEQDAKAELDAKARAVESGAIYVDGAQASHDAASQDSNSDDVSEAAPPREPAQEPSGRDEMVTGLVIAYQPMTQEQLRRLMQFCRHAGIHGVRRIERSGR